jgi:eukaryotic-like serine/threonine-protein kinase
MTTTPENERQQRIDEAIAGYHAALEAGLRPTPAEWAGRYPDIAVELHDYFANEQRFGSVFALSSPPSRSTFGRYRLRGEIGRGGQGVVYDAEDLRTGRRVALKIIVGPIPTDPRSAGKFREQARLVARLDHPNLVRLLDDGVGNGLPFLVMDQVDGINLRDVIHDLRRLRRRDSADDRFKVPPELSEPGPKRWCVLATIGAQLARALAHAHDNRVIHRDVKPSNILIDRAGSAFLTDFGIARTSDRPDDTTRTSAPPGTYRFMAPEQFRGWSDPRSDVYGLGLTLYELATLQHAFDAPTVDRLIEKVLTKPPIRPRRLEPSMPKDLERIILTAIEKEPSYRYPTASDLADDLDRFAGGQPIRVRPVNPARRFWSWVRRNPRPAAILFVVGLMLAVSVVSTILALKSQAQTARAQLLGMELRRHRDFPRVDGWRARSLELIRQAADRLDETLRSQAAAALADTDASRVRRFPFGSVSLAFDPKKPRLLMGGVTPKKGLDGRAHLFDLTTGELVTTERSGPGPVAFDAGGVALQVVSGKKGELALWDVEHGRIAREFEEPVDRTSVQVALDARAETIAAAYVCPSAKDFIAVWKDGSKRPTARIEGACSVLALSPDGRLIAIGNEAGHIRVWTLPQARLLADLRGALPIRAIAFGRDPHPVAHDGAGGWRLATGDAGAEIIIWDLMAGRPSAFCRGSPYEVTALAFAPDGTILASAGRGWTHIWDTATGSPLMMISAGDYAGGLAFSTDGLHLAMGSRNGATSASYVTELWALEPSPGISVLRGLSSRIERLTFTPDLKTIAALGHTWRIAVWTGASADRSHLLWVLDGPVGYTCDNFGLAVSRDGRWLAACSGREAYRWDLKSGRCLDRWSLPPGLVDRLVFDHTGSHLYSFRCETRDGETQPFQTDFHEHPRVGQLRDLLGPTPQKPYTTIAEFDETIDEAQFDPGGQFLAVVGKRGKPAHPIRELEVHNIASGERLWTLPAIPGPIAFDSTSTIVITPDPVDGSRSRLLEIDSGLPRGVASPRSFTFGPCGRSWASPGSHGIQIYFDGRPELSIWTDQNFGAMGSSRAFDRTGRFLVWETLEGAVHIADLDEVRKALREFGLAR